MLFQVIFFRSVFAWTPISSVYFWILKYCSGLLFSFIYWVFFLRNSSLCRYIIYFQLTATISKLKCWFFNRRIYFKTVRLTYTYKFTSIFCCSNVLLPNSKSHRYIGSNNKKKVLISALETQKIVCLFEMLTFKFTTVCTRITRRECFIFSFLSIFLLSKWYHSREYFSRV